jgi:uncharacterized protein (TIGR03435 family)
VATAKRIAAGVSSYGTRLVRARYQLVEGNVMTTLSRHVPLTALALAASIAVAQTPPTPAFEVASVRLWAPGTRSAQRVTDTRVDLLNVSLREVVLMAFRIGTFQLAAPDWAESVRIDISATLPAGATRAQVPQMLQVLLRERFGLMTHVEPRPVTVYELVVGETGVKMSEVEPLAELPAEAPAPPPGKPGMSALFETVDGSTRSTMWPGGTSTVTARSRYDQLFTDRRTSMLDAERMTMAELARILATTLDEPIIDRTGLTGVYRFKIELPLDARVVRVLVREGTLTDPTGASPFAAVESLGLKLQRRQAPLDVVVVDRLARTPTEN